MSGSYDRPGGRRNTLPSATGFDPFDDVMTGPATGPDAQSYHYGTPAQHAPRTTATDLTSTHRRVPTSARGSKQTTHTPVVPPDSVTGRSLTLVISIMCFLACLTAGAVYMINESANAWLKDIASEVTVQVEPQENVDTDKDRAATCRPSLGASNGIARAKALSLEDATKLLEPWLGQSDVLE